MLIVSRLHFVGGTDHNENKQQRMDVNSIQGQRGPTCTTAVEEQKEVNNHTTAENEL